MRRRWKQHLIIANSKVTFGLPIHYAHTACGRTYTHRDLMDRAGQKSLFPDERDACGNCKRATPKRKEMAQKLEEREREKAKRKEERRRGNA